MKPSPRSLSFRLLAGLALFLIAQSPLTVSAGWTLVWADEFTGPDNSAPDSSKWGYDIGGWGWGNGEEQYYTDSTDNARIENNELVIELRDDTGTNGNPDLYFGNDYTSARLLTKGKFDQLYGRFEARIKVPEGGNGLWPAFWMLGADFPETPWPFCGEIDIMEYVSRLPNEVFGTIHGPGYSGGESFGNIYDLGVPVVNDYHTYAVEWEPDEIRWYFDGIHYHTANPADVAPNTWVFNESNPPQATDGFFMILNVAIGGNFGGAIDAANITFPTKMLVDYVRVYEQTVTNPQLVLTKTGTFQDENANTYADVGETIDYTFTIQNTGDVELTNVTVTDPLATVAGGPAPASNLLANAGFETGAPGLDPPNWDIAASGGTVNTSGAYARTGGKSLLLDSTGAGDWASPNASQTFTATAGEEFNFKGYMYSPTGVTGASFGLLKIEFRDALDNLLNPGAGGVSIGSAAAAPFFGAESNVFLDNTSPSGTWIFTEIQAVAPAGTASVGFYIINVNEPAATQAMYFDDIEASVVPTGLTLGIGATDSTTYTATYTITQADIDAGQVVNTATAMSAEGASDPDTETTLLTAAPLVAELTLTKTGTFNDLNEDGFADPGETITYSFTIQNTGDVPLTNIMVSDPLVTVSGNPLPPPNLLTNDGFEGDLTGWTQNLSGGSASASTDYARGSLIMTGIIDGPLTGGLPKAIELYATTNISDLSAYGIELVSNSNSTTNGPLYFLSGSATAGQYLYVATEATQFSAVFGFAPDFTSSIANHNGDDDFYIYGPGNALVDIWGGSDGLDNSGTPYDVLDSWAYRIGGTGPSTSFDVAEWTIAPVDSLDGLDAAQVGATVPFGSYVSDLSTHSLLIDSTGAGDWSSPNLSQTVPASPGQEFNLQGWMLAPTGGIPGASFGLLKIEFTDGGGTALDPASVSIGGSAAAPFYGAESTPFLNNGSATETWIFTETQAVAPVGTVNVRFVVLNVNQPGNPGQMYFDDIRATDVNGGSGPLNLLPGQSDSTTYSGTYTITEADINAGQVVNTATASSDEGASGHDTEETLLTENPDGDFDNDGISNFFERAYVLDLFSPDSLSSLPSGNVVEDAGQKYVSITYRRESGGSGVQGLYNGPNWEYTVEVSNDLGLWESNIPELGEVGLPIDNADGSETATVRSNVPLTPGTGKFLRLSVTPGNN